MCSYAGIGDSASDFSSRNFHTEAEVGKYITEIDHLKAEIAQAKLKEKYY